MRKTVIVSDVSGKECVDPVDITLKREGYDIRIAGALHIGAVRLDVAADELVDILNDITFVKKRSVAPLTLPNLPKCVTADEHTSIAPPPVFFDLAEVKRHADRKT